MAYDLLCAADYLDLKGLIQITSYHFKLLFIILINIIKY